MPRTRAPHRTYLVMSAVSTLVMTIGFATVTIYRFTVADLTPFQLVIVGTAMEAAVFAAEIPTGVVADVVSRRASIVVGHLGMGVGLVLEGMFPAFWPILLAQVLWGVSYTFTSGATEAWLAGEVGEDRFGDVLLAGARIGYPAALVGTVASYGLGLVDLQLPLVVAGAASLALGGWLALSMTERGFTRIPAAEREGFQDLVRTTRDGIAVVRRRRVLVLLGVAIVLWGAASEAFDRLGQPHLIEGVGLPGDPDRELLVLGALSVASIVLGYVVTRVAERVGVGRDRRRAARWVIALAGVEVASTLVFGLASSVAAAVVAFLVIERSRGLRRRLLQTWIVPLTEPRTRATALSVLAQGDSFGQALVGPGLGAIGSLASLPAAITASAAVLVAPVALAAAAARADEPVDGRPVVDEESAST